MVKLVPFGKTFNWRNTSKKEPFTDKLFDDTIIATYFSSNTVANRIANRVYLNLCKVIQKE